MKKIIIFFSFFILISCSSDSNTPVVPIIPTPIPVIIDPVVVTLPPTFYTGSIRFNGEITKLGDGYSERGFCWSLNLNPTLNDDSVTTDGSGSGVFFKDYSYNSNLNLEQTYNIRSYVNSNSKIIYGNNLTITTPRRTEVSILPVINIYSKVATLSGSVINNIFATSIAHKGFCVSAASTPTLNNSVVVESSGTSFGDFTLDVDNLSRNTNYNVRSFAYNNTSNVYYSEVVSFKTVGFLGASGGYVIYDKGSFSDGWRFLEASPIDMTYNSSNLIKWGCTGTEIYQTSLEVGTGLENTNRIVQFCNDANCAARICKNYSINGLNDWFLPSKGELYILIESLSGLVTLGNQTNQVHWSSSEYDSGTAHLVNTFYGFGPAFGISKSNTNLVRAIRRY